MKRPVRRPLSTSCSGTERWKASGKASGLSRLNRQRVRLAQRFRRDMKAAGGSFRFTCLRCGGTIGLAFDPMRGRCRMPPNTNSARIATLLAVALLAAAAFPRTADAYSCFWFQSSGGPRYSYCVPSNAFEPWYGPSVDYSGTGYGGFPGGYSNQWSGWSGAFSTYAPHGYGSSGYAPKWWWSQWQTPSNSPWQGSTWQTMSWANGYPYRPGLSPPPGMWPMGGIPSAGGHW